MNFQGIKNIIFDLGGVIINLDLNRTFSHFATASGKSTEELKKLFFNNQLWQAHEIGQLSDQELRIFFRENYFPNFSDEQIDDIWNALLLDIPKERIDLLIKLSSNYQLFMLSNTNGIHEKSFTQILKDTHGINTFDDIFKKVYYSHLIKVRKPDKESYLFVLDDNNIQPHETLFIDDNEDNIHAANALGIQTLLVQPPNTIIELLKNA